MCKDGNNWRLEKSTQRELSGLISEYYADDNIKDNKKDVACGTKRLLHIGFWLENLTEKSTSKTERQMDG